MKQLISVDDLNLNRIKDILYTAEKLMRAEPHKFSKLCQGKVLSIIFFNRSLRSSAILKAAMYRLGGSTIDIIEEKYESEMDVYNSILPLSDISAIRANNIDFYEVNSLHKVPLINSLCNKDEHTLSSLWHLFTMKMLLGNLYNLDIGIYGQTLHCRPYMSLQKLLTNFNCKFYIDPIINSLGNPECLNTYLEKKGSKVTTGNIESFIRELDVLLISDGLPMTEQEDDELKFDNYAKLYRTFDNKLLDLLPEHSVMNYMMPRFLFNKKSTIDETLLNHQKFYNSTMINYGVFITMALILDILEVTDAL